jgi:hypothetical protein
MAAGYWPVAKEPRMLVAKFDVFGGTVAKKIFFRLNASSYIILCERSLN